MRAGLRARDGYRGAFTLIELMIVVAIMGVILTMSIPVVYKVTHRQPLAKAIFETEAVLSNARKLAILRGQEVEVVFHPREGRLEVSGGGSAPGASSDSQGPFKVASVSVPRGSGLSAQFSDEISIEDLDINLIPGGFRDAEVAKVRFFPNGTSDELRLFLRSDKNERCEITLEVTTGLVSVEHDVLKFR